MRYLPVSNQVLQAMKKLIAVRADDWKKDVPILCTYEVSCGSKSLFIHIHPTYNDISAYDARIVLLQHKK